VTLGALAGRESGEQFDPVRLTPIHDWHASAGAVFTRSGLWLRPKCYPQPGEAVVEAVQREARAVRSNIGLVNVSTLGKIDIQGPDAAEFLDRIYIDGFRIREGASGSAPGRSDEQHDGQVVSSMKLSAGPMECRSSTPPTLPATNRSGAQGGVTLPMPRLAPTIAAKWIGSPPIRVATGIRMTAARMLPEMSSMNIPR
jgi:hypothetical protein